MEKTIIEKAQEVLNDWEDPHIVRPAIFQEEPYEVQFAKYIIDLNNTALDILLQAAKGKGVEC